MIVKRFCQALSQLQRGEWPGKIFLLLKAESWNAEFSIPNSDTCLMSKFKDSSDNSSMAKTAVFFAPFNLAVPCRSFVPPPNDFGG